MARRPVAVSEIPEGGFFGGTDVHDLRAAGVEAAARRRVDGAGHVAREQNPIFLPQGIGHRRGGKERLGVRVLGIAVEGRVGRGLDDLSQVHHQDPVAEVFHHRQVVGDDHERQVEFPFQPHEQVDDLGLDGNVQGRDRLVADEDGGVQRQPPCDAHPLPLPPRKFVGIPPPLLRAQAHRLQQKSQPLRPFLPGVEAVNVHGIGKDLVHGHPGIERGIGVLEDELHFPPDPAQGLPPHVRHVLAPEPDRASRHRRQPGDGHSRSGLPATRLAHDPQRLALVQMKVDPVHRVDVANGAGQDALLDGKVNLEVLGADERLGHGASAVPGESWGMCNQQRTAWPDSISVNSGSRARQTSMTCLHRAWNLQPSGRS